jgi:alkaline phosphatase D
LREEVALPTAGPGVALDTSQPLTRLAFGSCNRQDKAQDYWAVIAAKNPQLFLTMGDNVYGDIGFGGDATMNSFRRAYARQAAYPEFKAFRAKVPMFALWDDHDYGPNDGGRDFAFKEFSETIFDTFWGTSAPGRSHPGTYDSLIIGPKGERVQLIMLDTRYFRSELTSLPVGDPRATNGYYVPSVAPDQDMLGAAQWQWLEAELAKPADLRVIVSSIQVLTDAHRYEAWDLLPAERERLYGLLGKRAGGGLVILSGDRHSGAIYRHAPAAAGEELVEITASSFNMAFGTEDDSAREPDPKRISKFYGRENFGLMDIDWAARKATLRLMDIKGGEVVSTPVSF